jgi:hypothetical protein
MLQRTEAIETTALLGELYYTSLSIRLIDIAFNCFETVEGLLRHTHSNACRSTVCAPIQGASRCSLQ